MYRPLIALVVAAAAWPALAAAQECTPDKNSNEAKLFAHYMVPLGFDAAEAPVVYPVAAMRLGVEAAYVPPASAEERTPTVCQPGQGPLNTNSQSVLVRPRLLLSGQHGLYLELSWVPPVSVNGVKSNLFGFSAGRTAITGKNSSARIRIFTVLGSIKGAFTCSPESITDPTDAACFGSQVSADKFKPTMFGGDVSIARAFANRHLIPYVGIGVTFLRPRFEVNHTSGDVTDHTKIKVNMTRFTAHGGLTWLPSSRVLLSAEAYSAPSDGVTGKFMLSWVFKAGKKGS
jgi:opacity protein-like surface antigen